MAREISDGPKKTIGETIKQLRLEKLWTQAELASRLGTTTISIGRWENNITRPSLHFQQQLCEVFGKSPEDLGFLPQKVPEREESSASNDQKRETEPGQRALTTFPEHTPDSLSSLAPVPPASFQPALTRGNTRLWQRRSFLFVMACLSLLLLLSGVFFYGQHILLSASRSPSCQLPSSTESAAAIYTQVMCRHALFSSELDRQDGLRWDENDQCRFQQGTYHVLLPATAYVAECFAHLRSFGPNIALQVDITVVKGYSGGLVFRAEGPSSNWDVITSRVPIDIWGQYNFDLANTNVPCHLSKDPLDPNYCHSPHGTITYGTGAANTMTVITLGSLVYLYVNGFFIDRAQAPTSSPLSGFLGVFANGNRTTADVAFHHFQIWNL